MDIADADFVYFPKARATLVEDPGETEFVMESVPAKGQDRAVKVILMKRKRKMRRALKIAEVLRAQSLQN